MDEVGWTNFGVGDLIIHVVIYDRDTIYILIPLDIGTEVGRSDSLGWMEAYGRSTGLKILKPCIYMHASCGLACRVCCVSDSSRFQNHIHANKSILLIILSNRYQLLLFLKSGILDMSILTTKNIGRLVKMDTGFMRGAKSGMRLQTKRFRRVPGVVWKNDSRFDLSRSQQEPQSSTCDRLMFKTHTDPM